MANVKAIIAAHLSQRQRAINKQVERAEILDEDRLLCRIIRVAGNIDVPNKPGFVWCQEYSPSNDTNPFHAFNSEVQAREGLDVWIEEGMGGRREVTKWNNATIVNTANYAAQKYLPTHHSDHEWPDFKPGPDVVNVYPRSLSMLRTYPGEGGALTISASSLRYIKGNVLVIFPGKNSLDISAAQPASGLARYVGIYLDPDDNTLKSVNGATTGDSPVITPDSPAFPESAILSANVRLNGDQTTFSEVDMIDVRQILDSSGAIDGTRVSKLVSPDGSVDPAFETDNSGRLSNASEFTYPWEGSTISANLLVKTLDVADYNNLVLKRSTDTSFRGAQVMMLRSKAGDTAVADGITIGILSFSGHDGTDYNEAAKITAVVDGAVSANTVPMALVFDVSADQSAGLKTRLKLAPTVVDIGDVAQSSDVDVNIFTDHLIVQPTTDTATAFQVLDADGGTPILNVDSIDEQLLVTPGSVIAGNDPGLGFVGIPDTGIAADSQNLAFWESGQIVLNFADTLKEIRLPSDFKYSFSSATNNNAASDTSFTRHAAGVIRTDGVLVVDSDLRIATTASGARLDVNNSGGGTQPTLRLAADSGQQNAIVEGSLNGGIQFRLRDNNDADAFVFTDISDTDLLTLYRQGFQEMYEITAPGAGAVNTYRLFAEDNGAGKTRVMIQFATGAAVQIAIQP